MQLRTILPALIALGLAITLATAASVVAVRTIEKRSQFDVHRVLDLNGFDWVDVAVDGLQVKLSGSAPDEATRFRALTLAGTIVDAARVIDMMDVADPEPIVPPRFSIEILRNDDGISLIGLIPAAMDREATVERITGLANGTTVTDLMEIADYPAPANWDAALEFGLEALANLPRSKISIAAAGVDIKAISDSAAEKRRLEAQLARKAPDKLQIKLEITAPRPVITPFTLRFVIDERGARFDACSTDTEAGREKILRAASEAGLTGKASCTIGLGIPSPNWDQAVVIAIGKLAELGGGSITFSDADVTLVAPDTTPQDRFDTVVGQLTSALPDVFSLTAVLPEPVVIDGTGEGSGPPEFVATLSPEGGVQLRGRIRDDRARETAESFARAAFGSAQVTGSMRLDDTLPDGWSTRVLASLQALGFLNNGSVVIQPDIVEIRGTTGDPEAKAEISRILSEKLGEAAVFRIAVDYEPKLDPVLNLPTAEDCVRDINQVIASRKITFDPGSADITGESRESVDKIAEIMKNCTDFPMEIAGYTDSQGRESMNETLSQTRADAVLNALLARRVLTSNLSSKGYGEADPIADNGTEEGREANRRIEFRLILPDEETAEDKTATEPAQDSAGTEADKPDESAVDADQANLPADTEQSDAPAAAEEQTEKPDEQN